jgi:hypothetical protein
MKPIILSDIITELEYNKLCTVFDLLKEDNGRFFEKSRFDRHSLHRPLALLSVAKRVKPIIEDILGLKLEYDIAMISCYKEGGRCPPHHDAENSEFGFAFCIKKNISWPFFVDDVAFDIEERQAILFNGYKSLHYRQGVLEKDQYMGIAFLHFKRKNEENI